MVVDSTFRLTGGGETEPGGGADRFILNERARMEALGGRREKREMETDLQLDGVSHRREARFEE